MIDNPLDWLAFASELEDVMALKKQFSSFIIKQISRVDNTRADFLAKKARSRGISFSYVSSTAPDWLPQVERIYVGDGKVFHFTRRGGLEIGAGTFLDINIEFSAPNRNPCLNCGDQSNLEGVISSCLKGTERSNTTFFN
ncbi:hypothetical protein EUTSA_v10027205mg [Eutrema salsugineum]|uniref:Uncharacterized protein n=1 Tax=Eutrema salsugineum TaxID=72664 RepID=V4M078_EUTSA|nr:hypothetical protein EUTSA_v10027205mg [Eutrema salsugineum]